MSIVVKHKLSCMNTQNVFFYIVLFLLVGAFYCMNTLEPLRCDDLLYQFYWYGERIPDLREPVDLSNKIDSFNDAFMSQINHYFVMNGRFSVHYIVSCFCGFLGRPLFNVVNTIVYALFLLGCVRLLGMRFNMNSMVTISLLWLGLPIQHIFWYSISFAVNYLWTSTALIFFFICIKSHFSISNSYSILKCMVLFVASFIVGTMHEGFSLPMSGSVFIYLLFHRQSLNARIVCLALGLWLGTAVIVFSPGTIGRASGSMYGMGINDFLLMKMDVFMYSKRFYLFLIFLLIGFGVNKKGIVLFLKNHLMEVYFIIFDFIIVLSVPHYSQRIEFPLELMSSLLSINLFLNSRIWVKMIWYFCPVIILLLLAHVPLTVYYANKTSMEYTEMLSEYFASSEGKAHYQDYDIPKIFNPYVKRLDNGVEREFISFVYNKEMTIE